MVVKCPKTVKKYGWCGVLALCYALKMKIPGTEKKFSETLENFEKIIGTQKKWKAQSNKNKNTHRGAITYKQTEKILNDKKPNGFELEIFDKKCSVKNWLKKVKTSTRYIVHSATHAMYLEIPKSKGGWQMWDQSGKKTKKDCKGKNIKIPHSLQKNLNRKVKYVFRLID